MKKYKKPKTLEEEIEQKFKPRILWNVDIAESFKRLGDEKRANKIAFCGTETEWLVPKEISGPWKLKRANFCKDRICNMCAWRRSRKIYGQVSQIMDKIQDDYNFIFLTLSIQNCSGEKLPEVLDILYNGFELLMNKTKKTECFKGYFKNIEITTHPEHPRSWEYHPHIHTIIAVNKSYFTSRDYINHKEFVELWRQKCKLNYDPIIEVHKIKPDKDVEKRKRKIEESTPSSIKGAVCECTKYAIKPNSLIYNKESGGKNNNATIDREIITIANAIERRRLCSLGGIFKKTAKELKLDDMIEGDLINTDTDKEKIRSDIEYVIKHYNWKIGYGYINEYTRKATEEDLK